MYAKEFEDLLKEYLTDGIITSKERQVLLKKAQQLGYDVDEVDLYIDAQQQKCDQAVESATAKKRGKTCPRCGASVQSMQLTCPECGFEFNNKEANASARELMNMLDKCSDTEKQVSTIENYPIPNSRENLLEFISSCMGRCRISLSELSSSDKAEICMAWRRLSQQVVIKAQLMLKDDPEVMKQVKKLEKLASKKIRLYGEAFVAITTTSSMLLLGCLVCCLLYFVDGDEISSKDKSASPSIENVSGSTDDEATQGDVQKVVEYVKDGELSEAKDYLVGLKSAYEMESAYIKVVTAYIKDGDYDSAEELGLDYKSKTNNDFTWQGTSLYTLLKSKFKSAGKDFSALKSKYESDEE